MADTESLRQIAHSRAPLSTWLGVVLLFALFGVIVLAIIGPMPRGSDYEETRAKKRMEKLKSVREDAETALSSYAWVDDKRLLVHCGAELNLINKEGKIQSSMSAPQTTQAPE